jgi:cation diffusion facilitator family transporter
MPYQTLRWPILLSIAAAVFTIGLKFTAFAVTGSAGLFSDALESLVNLFAASMALFALWYSNKPTDADHPFGHEKIEFFSSGLEGVLVAVAGVTTAYYAVDRLLHPKPIEQLGLGTTLALVASAVNFAVALLLLRTGKKHRSIVLEADGHHLMTDVYTSLAIVGGLVLVMLTGVQWLDPALALVVGLNIIRTGFGLVRRSFDGLMDKAWPSAEQESFRAAIQANLPAKATFHLLRTRQAGRRRFADFHLLLPGAASLKEAHDLAHELEAKLQARFSELVLTMHIEPIEELTSWEMGELEQLGETASAPVQQPPQPPIDD